MILTNTLTKKLLENLVHQTFSKFGNLSCSSLLDSLKLLGFSYATFAGISINIEDLKTPNSKNDFLDQANFQIQQVSQQWKEGMLSDTERFQTIIDSWNIATQSLKNRIIDYYQNYDPTNNLYIMAFSGARGNMSQVRQLVGMRGLMSDQDGKIIDLPIQTNFREGLSSIDYIISSYGARKGIVDTALKTADSGYLTRRLIYLAQDLVIRQKNCGSKAGVILVLDKNTKITNLIGRFLISKKKISIEKSDFLIENYFLTESILNNFKKDPFSYLLNIRSSLTCKLNGSICQNCYGWDLAQGKIISLGEAVGIIAAQSIGEPGTQLTMRTFHTGGIFTGELLTQIEAPFSGKLLFPKSLKTIPYRTSHGMLVLKLQQEITLFLINWQGIVKEIFLDIDSFFYTSQSVFIKKGDLIAEFMNQSVLPGGRKLKPILSPISGELRFESLLIRKIFREKRILKVNQEDGNLWLSSGKIFLLPQESEDIFTKELTKEKPFSSIVFTFPYSGIAIFSKNILTLLSQEKKFLLNFSKLKFEIKNITSKFFYLIKNYQYLDPYTVLGKIYFFPNSEGKIYLIRKKNATYQTIFFVVTEDEVWKINFEQENDFSFCEEKKTIVREGTILNKTIRTKNSGFFLKQDGFQMVFQLAFPIFLTKGTILNYKQGDFIEEKGVVANLVNYTQQTEDIVQGLPKIEELIEARKPKGKSYLAIRPGIIMNSFFLENKKIFASLKNQIIHCIIEDIFPVIETSLKNEKQRVYISHSIFLKEPLVIFANKIYKAIAIPSFFQPIQKDKKKKKEYFLKNLDNEILTIQGKSCFSKWIVANELKKEEEIFLLKKNKLTQWLTISITSLILKNKRGDLIIVSDKKGTFYLEALNPVIEYKIPLSAKMIFPPGSFVDIGEPFTEGIIDIHELLHILFNYHSNLDGILLGSLKGLQKFQLLLVNSIQAIYQSQGINISSKHIEIIVRQMTSKVIIKDSGDTPFLPGELIRFSLIHQISQCFQMSETKMKFKIPNFEPLLISSTNISLTKEGFLSSAGFQETKRVLSKAAMESSSDWLRGLKECVILGRMIPAGSTFLNYKNYLDNLFLFKNIKP